jgi:hypothetical protein
LNPLLAFLLSVAVGFGCIRRSYVARASPWARQAGATPILLPVSIIEGRYRLVYRVQAKGIQIVTVFEGHRQFPAEDVVE